MPSRSASMACPLCDHTWAEPYDTPTISACPSCGVPMTVPPPRRDIASDGLFHQGSYAGRRLERRSQWLAEAEKRLAWVRAHVPAGRLLELGSATGEFVAVAERAGYEITGLEPSAWAVENSRDLTSQVVCAAPEEWLAQQVDRFDAVVAFHTLEHVPDPVSFLRALSSVLAPGGQILLEIPNGGARDLQQGEQWLHASLPDHVLHYREGDVRRLCHRAGLVVRDLECFTMREFDPPWVWTLRRARWLGQGQLTPSLDNLRFVAAPAA